jgi:hypothetical protein
LPIARRDLSGDIHDDVSDLKQAVARDARDHDVGKVELS